MKVTQQQLNDLAKDAIRLFGDTMDFGTYDLPSIGALRNAIDAEFAKGKQDRTKAKIASAPLIIVIDGALVRLRAMIYNPKGNGIAFIIGEKLDLESTVIP